MCGSCKNCTDRHLHCHSKCEKYLKFLAENEKKKQAIRLENNLYNAEMERIKNDPELCERLGIESVEEEKRKAE